MAHQGLIHTSDIKQTSDSRQTSDVKQASDISHASDIEQSSDIRQGVTERKGLNKEQAAGDQGMMFGYATNETVVLMPAPITYSHRLVEQQAFIRKSGKLSWLRPDAKSQVSFVY